MADYWTPVQYVHEATAYADLSVAADGQWVKRADYEAAKQQLREAQELLRAGLGPFKPHGYKKWLDAAYEYIDRLSDSSSGGYGE